MRPLKRQNEAHEKGDQKDDGNGVVANQYHLVQSVTPLQAPSLERGDEGPVDRLRRYLVEPGKITVQPICNATDVSKNVSHGKHSLLHEDGFLEFDQPQAIALGVRLVVGGGIRETLDEKGP